MNLGQIQLTLDEVGQAEKSYRQAIANNEASGRFFGVMASYASMIMLQQRLGKLAAAKATGRKGLAWLRQWQEQSTVDYPAEGELRRALSAVCYERNELSEVQEHMQRGIAVCQYSNPSGFARCLHHLFFVALAQDEVETAVQLQQHIDSILDELPSIPRLESALRSERLARLGRIQAAVPQWRDELAQWLISLDGWDSASFKLHQQWVDLIAARVLIALDQPETALKILDPLADGAEWDIPTLGVSIRILPAKFQPEIRRFDGSDTRATFRAMPSFLLREGRKRDVCSRSN